MSEVDLQRALNDPADVFEGPDAVISRERLAGPVWRSPGGRCYAAAAGTCLAPLNEYWAEGEPRDQEVGEGGVGLAVSGVGSPPCG